MKKLIVFNNPFFNDKYYTEIDFITGWVIYRKNLSECKNDNESYFHLSKEKLTEFLKRNIYFDNWQSTYRREGYIVLDGFRWSVKFINGSEKEISGENSKPQEFDFFINELELLLERDFGGTHS